MEINKSTTKKRNNYDNRKYLYVQEDIINRIDEMLPENEKRHRAKYYYPIHAINSGKMMNRNNKEGGYVALNSALLRKVITTRHAGKVKNFLLENNFIDCDFSYSIDLKKSSGYCISDQYILNPLKRIAISDKTISKKMAINQKGLAPIEKAAYQNLKQVEIDHEKAKIHLRQKLVFEAQKSSFFHSTTFHQHSNTTKHKHVLPYVVTFLNNSLKNNNLELSKNDKKQLKSALDRYNAGMISIDYINDRNFFLHRDKVGQRLHTNISNLPSDLRQFLSVKDYNLVNIDIANSQPFILNTLLVENGITGPDVSLYRELTSSGELWYYLMQRSRVSDKRKFKSQMFEQTFYGRPGRKRYCKSAKIFRETFPTVWKFIKDFKKNDLKQNYSRLAIEMQRRESKIMIDQVARELTRKKIYWLSIHDSIVCDKTNAQQVQRIVKHAFKKEYELTPTLKIEKL